MPKIIAVVVTYNRLELLKECLSTFRTMTMCPDKVVVVDNASTDGTSDYLAGLSDDLFHVLRLEKNAGGAGGFCAGMREAVHMGCDALWIMDDDTIPGKDSLRVLSEELFCREDNGFAGSMVLWTDGNRHQMNKPLFLTNDDEAEAVRLVQSSSFVSLLVKSSIVREVGLPYKDFFIWGDDSEFTKRITEKGYRGLYVTDSVVLHKTAANYGPEIHTAPYGTAWKFYYGTRNAMFLDRKRYRNPFTFFLKELNHLRLALHNIGKRAPEERRDFRRSVLKGFRDGFSFRPDIEYIDD